MTEQEKARLRETLLEQCVILAFGLATLVLYTIGQRRMGEADFVTELKARFGLDRAERKKAHEDEALGQVQKEISQMEHTDG